MAEQCEKCGGQYSSCVHSEYKLCFCKESDKSHICLNGRCIFCLFDGQLWEEDWSVPELVLSIALKAYKLGKRQGKAGKFAMFFCSSDNRITKAIYKHYKHGYKTGFESILRK